MDSVPSALGPLAVVLARRDDLPIVIEILNEAAAWLNARGIAQWPHPLGERMWQITARGIEQSQVYLARAPQDGQAIATLRLEWTDSEYWLDDPDVAAYVHSLAIRSQVHGQQVGAALIGWAKDRARAAGRPFLRLDCAGENAALCAYYERLGFVCRGQVLDRGYVAALYEMAV